LALFSVLSFGTAYCHQKKINSATPASRLDLLRALLVQRTVVIDRYHKNTPDKSVLKGSYYSDKAPGTVSLALVPFTNRPTKVQNGK